MVLCASCGVGSPEQGLFWAAWGSEPCVQWLMDRCAACCRMAFVNLLAATCLLQVNKWFEKQRKLKREETGEAPKRGRKASGAAKAAAAAAGGDAAAAVAAAAEGPTAAAAEEPVQQEGDVMEVDGEAAASEAVMQQQQQQQSMAEQAAADAQPMATDDVTAEAPAATPAPAAQPAAAAPAAAGASPAADGASPAAVGSAGKGAAGSKPGKTPASAAPARIVSAEEKAQLMAAMEAEAAELRQQGLAPPLQPLPDGSAASGAAPSERMPFSDARLAAAVAGQRVPLSQLTAALLPLFKAPDGEAPLEEAVLRRWVLGWTSGRQVWAGWPSGCMACMARMACHAPSEHGRTCTACVFQAKAAWPQAGARLLVPCCPPALRTPVCSAAALWTWPPARALGPRMVSRAACLGFCRWGPRTCGWRERGVRFDPTGTSFCTWGGGGSPKRPNTSPFVGQAALRWWMLWRMPAPTTCGSGSCATRRWE